MTGKKRNRLALEKSPYLLQHADNPVDWLPWGDEAFEKAAAEDRPVFLSIGYSTCHWCHVMARESFEDEEVGRLMNETFVSIKVDREERPDIDMLYMSVCQTMTGSGGWPLTILLTPDRQPFFAGTYIPRNTRHGRIGLVELIPRVREMWAGRKDEVVESARRVTETIRQAAQPSAGENPGEAVLKQAFDELTAMFDERYGGFGHQPKFPTYHNLLFLLRYWKRTGRMEPLQMVERTLKAILAGGIHDHIGDGFHRYSTDRQWLIPHFEKMLYDQALLAGAFLETYQATGNAEYAGAAEGIFRYVLRDMASPEGGFYSAEDADSEGVEGKFYLWTREEIERALGPEESGLFIRAYDISEKGNFADDTGGAIGGRNIPHLPIPISELAAKEGINPGELEKRLEAGRSKLFDAREKRVRPHRDDKVLADWNGLMAGALAQGARVLGEPSYAAAAGRAVDFIYERFFTPQGRLLHRYRDGEVAVQANLDDYAFLIHGLLELYEATFEVRHLEWSLELCRQMISHFWDSRYGGFFFSADDGEALLTRQKEVYDGAVPSGNSVALMDLLRLGRLTADLDLEDKAEGMLRAFSEALQHMPSAHTRFLLGLDFVLGPSCEVVIAGDSKAADTAEMVKALNGRFVPNKVVILLPSETDRPAIKDLVPYLGQTTSRDGRATAYVCRNYACGLPVTDPAALVKALDSS